MTDSIGPEAYWRAALAEGRFLLQRAVSSGTVFFPPRLAEPGSGDTAVEWIEASGMGNVYSLTIISPKPPVQPYNVALIDLDEGARLMSRVDGISPDALHIGQRVRAKIIEEDGAPLLVFVPAGH
jgi:uncharacterized OB-fold protein